MSKPPPIAVLTLELHIAAAQSLKDRRQVVASIRDRVKARFNVAVAEVGDTEKWQSATLAICTVGNDRRHLERELRTILAAIEDWQLADVVRQRIEFL
ncbi:MAG: DUF503 domain-containing protein [Candidatus Neomarinimicrobiota bacterium]